MSAREEQQVLTRACIEVGLMSCPSWTTPEQWERYRKVLRRMKDESSRGGDRLANAIKGIV